MRRVSYSATIWTETPGARMIVTTVQASDAPRAIRAARRLHPEAVAVEVRAFGGGKTVLAAWGDRSRSPVCDQCGVVGEGAAS